MINLFNKIIIFRNFEEKFAYNCNKLIANKKKRMVNKDD